MMKSPWIDNDKAFAPMFTESIVISCKRSNKTIKQTIEAAVFVDMTGDAISDNTLDTDREDIGIVCRKEDWAFVQKLLRGDSIERTEVNGVKYSVKEVKHDSIMGWVITARSI